MTDLDTPPMDDEDDRGVLNYLFILVVVVFFCCSYCFRRTRPSDDPADDPIAGWIPNPSGATPSLEEKRELIESKLIIRKVLESDERSVSNNSASSIRSWVAETPIATYVSAFTARRSGQRTIKFSEPIEGHSGVKSSGMRRSQSNPVFPNRQMVKRTNSSPADVETGDTEAGGVDFDFFDTGSITSANRAPTTSALSDDGSFVFDMDMSNVSEYGDNEDNNNNDREEQTSSATRSPSKKLHRRKTDIVVRRLAST